MNSISDNATKQPDTPQKSCSFVQDFQRVSDHPGKLYDKEFSDIKYSTISNKILKNSLLQFLL